MKYDSIDLGNTELVNAKIQNLAAAPANPVKGQFYYDTALNALYIYDGTAWGKTWTSTNMGNGLNAGTVDGYSLNQSVETTGSPSFVNLTVTGGTGALSLKATAGDHVYMQFFARTASQSTRSGFIGYAAAGQTAMNISNEIAGGNILLVPGTGGIVSATTSLSAVSGTFTAAEGLAPLTVSSTTKVALLNVEAVDGHHMDQDVLIASSPTFANLTIAGALNTSGQIKSETAIAFSTSVGAAQKIYTGSLLASSTYSDSASVPSQGIFAKGNIRTAGQLQIDVATGTVPIVMTNQTVIPNMNADLHDSMHADAAATATTVAARDGSGDLTARVFRSAVTGIAPAVVASSVMVANWNANYVNGFIMNQNLRTTDSPTFASATLTGTLTTGADRYMSNAIWGLSLQNSDIVKVNGIYFNDLSDAVGEGLMFMKTGAAAGSTTITDYTQLYVDGSGNLWVGSTNITAGISGAATPADAQTMANTAEANAKAASIPLTQKGAVSGVATLGSDGKLTAGQIPTTLETTTGAQTKATTALNSAKSYTDTAVSTKANTADVYTKTETDSRIQAVIDAAPAALDTLNELAAALGDDPNFAATMTTSLAGKVDKITGKGLSTEDYTTAEKTKLSGIATGANAYVHPSTHAPSIIVQDSSNRFVTDAQIASWTAKQAALGFTPENAASKGAASGYAPLDSSSLVPLANLRAASTSVKGVVQLEDSISSTSVVNAATANAAKAAFDRAVSAETSAKAASVPLAGGTMTGALTAPSFKSGNYTVQYNATENSLDFIVA